MDNPRWIYDDKECKEVNAVVFFFVTLAKLNLWTREMADKRPLNKLDIRIYSEVYAEDFSKKYRRQDADNQTI